MTLTSHFRLFPVCSGVFITPITYTLDRVEAENGSSVNGNCPDQCVLTGSAIRRCDCATAGLGGESTTGTLIDGMVPIIDTTQRDSTGTIFVWASQLYTARRNTGNVNVTINFRFNSRFTLHEVELYLFNCPIWGIGAQSIHMNDAGLNFPSVSRLRAIDLGSVTLTGDMQNCASLTRVSIPIQNPRNERNYAIDFSTSFQWVHIGEVRFSDQPITTTAAPTSPTTQPPSTTTGKRLVS